MLTSILLSVGFLTACGLVLAFLIVLAERKILNYGPCNIDINNGERLLTMQGGSSLLSNLAEQQIFIPSACGGRGSCAYCKLKVLDGAGVIGPVEEPHLTPQEREQGTRLSCQVKVRNDLRIEIPSQLFAVKRYQGRVARKRPLTYDIVELAIDLVEPQTMDFVAGQYVQLESQEYKGRDSVMRAYSISSPPSRKGQAELMIRLVPNGICTTWVFEHLKEGQALHLSGPYGEFRLSDTEAPILFVAGGSGMAPIWSMLRDMEERGIRRNTTYFFGALTQRDLFLVDELSEMQKRNDWFTFVPALSNEPGNSGWRGEQGLITQVLKRHVSDASTHEAYLCGSPGMIDACVKVLKENGMPEDKILYDKFS